MRLKLEVCEASGAVAQSSACKLFDGVGGVIGRGNGCDWVIADPSRLISSQHGWVSYREGRYFLTDISSNGINVAGSDECLRKGQARLIGDGDMFQFGPVILRARLLDAGSQHSEQRFTAAGPIPDDAFLGLDPVQALDREQQHLASSPELEALRPRSDAPEQGLNHSAVDRDHLHLPRRTESATTAPTRAPAPPVNDTFWAQFSAALGTPLDGLDSDARQALAIKVARLFRLGIDGLQQNLRTCDELKNELQLHADPPSINRPNPLKDHMDSAAALADLLGAGEWGRLSAELTLAQAHRDLQAHQLALLAASRAAVRHTRGTFAPAHLLLCFERQAKPSRFCTDGAHWRAYQRHYQQLLEDNSAEPLLGGEFAKAYHEQLRLISTLHVDYPG